MRDKAMLVGGAVDDGTLGQTSAENSLARALGSPQPPAPEVGNAHDDSPTQTDKLGQDPLMDALDITGA